MHRHHHFIEQMLHDEMSDFYISMAIRAFAFSMISVFIPLLLFEQGYTMVEIFLFYALVTGSHAMLVAPVAKLSSRIGFRTLMGASVPFLLLFYWGIYDQHIPLLLLALTLGVQRALFWTGYHMHFVVSGSKRHTGRQLSVTSAVMAFTKAFSPFVGGMVLASAGFSSLFVVVAILLLLSVIPLFLSPDHHLKGGFDLKTAFHGRRKRQIWALMGYGFEGNATLILWPLIIYFLITDNFTIIGGLTSVSIVVSIVITLFIGRATDKFPRHHVLRIGSVANALIWLGRSLVTTAGGVFFVDAIGSVTRTMIILPFNSICYDRARSERERAGYIVFREIVINISACLLFVILMIGWSYTGSLVTGIFGSLALLLF